MAEGDPKATPETPPPQPRQRAPDPQVPEQTESKGSWELEARKTINRLIGSAIGIGLTGGFDPNLLWIPGMFTAGGSAVRIAKGDNVKEVLDDALVTAGAVGTVLPGIMELWGATVPLINTSTLTGKLAQAAYIGGGINPAFAASYHTVEHLYKNDFSPKGLGKHLTENVIPSSKRFAWAFPAYYLAPYFPNMPVPQVLQNYLGMPSQIPTFAGNALGASALGATYPVKTTSERKAIKEEKRQAKIYNINEAKNTGSDYQKAPVGQEKMTA